MAQIRLSRRGRTAPGSDRPGASVSAGHPAVPQPRDPGPQPDRGTPAGPVAVVIEATYDAATPALGWPAHDGGYQAVARLSGHIAAMHWAVYPVAGRRLGDRQDLLTECRAKARETQWALRLLEGHHAGEAAAARREPEAVHASLRQCLGRYRLAERALVARLEERLTAPEGEQLALGYRSALARAPTRPHPRGPHAGRSGQLAFLLHAFLDGVLEVVDCRPGVGRPD